MEQHNWESEIMTLSHLGFQLSNVSHYFFLLRYFIQLKKKRRRQRVSTQDSSENTLFTYIDQSNLKSAGEQITTFNLCTCIQIYQKLCSSNRLKIRNTKKYHLCIRNIGQYTVCETKIRSMFLTSDLENK